MELAFLKSQQIPVALAALQTVASGHGRLTGVKKFLSPLFLGGGEDPQVAWRYKQLGLLPEGTVGRAYWEFCTSRRFGFPGEAGGIPERMAFHDFGHILSGYETDAEGEIQQGAFQAGFTRTDGFSFLLFVIVQFHLGIKVTPIAEPRTGLFDVRKVIRAAERGAACRDDLSARWDHWAWVELPVEEARHRLGIPRCTPEPTSPGQDAPCATGGVLPGMGRWPPRSRLDRRQALAVLARGGALLVAACGTTAEGPACNLAPALTAGPYWWDAPLRRSDLRWDSQSAAGAGPRPGVPLALTLRLSSSADSRCRPVRGARVDLWHCDAQGAYSGIQDRGTGGRDFLRGYQITNDAGEVRFVTIHPGWYPGRAVHIHAKVRLFDPFGEVTTETSTQLFFDDAVTDAVLETEAYAGRGPRDTRNADDPILCAQPSPFVSVAGTPESGMQGRVEIGIRVGEIRRD